MWNMKGIILLCFLCLPLGAGAQSWMQRLGQQFVKKTERQAAEQGARKTAGNFLLRSAGAAGIQSNASANAGVNLDASLENALNQRFSSQYEGEELANVRKETAAWLKAFQTDSRLGPQVSSRNNALAARFEKNTFVNYKFFTEHKRTIQRTVKEYVSTAEDARYAQVISPERRMVFLGEEHYNAQTTQAVYQLVSQYKKAHNRPVILAVEVIETNQLSADGLITDKSQLSLRIPARYNQVFEKLLDEGVAIFPIEYRGDIEATVVPAARNGSSLFSSISAEKLENSLLASFAGVEMRNRGWAKALRALREKVGSDAMIMVWGGSMHFTPSVPGNLPRLLAEEKGMIFSFDRLSSKHKEHYTNWDLLRVWGETQGKIIGLWERNSGKNLRLIRVTENDDYAKVLGAHARVLIPRD